MKVTNIPKSKERKYFILSRLINYEHLSYQRLAGDYLVSRSSIANDILFIKEFLSKDNVQLAFDNTGTYIKGDEKTKQKILKRVTILLTRNEQSNKHILSEFIKPDLITKIKDTFICKIKEWNLEIPENYVNDIAISIAIVIYRGQKGFYIRQSNRTQLGKLFFQFEKYPLIYELLKTIEKKGMYQFSHEEFRYLSYVILGNGFKFFMKNAAIPEGFRNKVRELITSVSKNMGIDFNAEIKLENDLLLHLYQMILRLQAGMTVINPLLNEIKQNYSRLFGIVWYAMREFGSQNNLVVSNDEVAFITIHFQAALERQKNTKKILFVCPNGIGTSALISAKMHQILPDVTIIEVVSFADLVNQDLSDVALIITTVKLDELDTVVPIAEISPMLTLEDIKTIMNEYIDLTMLDNKNISLSNEIDEISKFVTGHVFFDNLRDKNEVIEYLLKTNDWHSKENLDLYRKSVYEREKLQSTYLGNGFAIPHGDPKYVFQSFVSILILKKPINWGINKVDVIAMLMIKKEDKNILEPVMSLIMGGIENKKQFINKIMEDNKSD